MIRLIRKFFASPEKTCLFNAIWISACILANILFQVFCIPVLWAAIVLAICFLNTIFYPILISKEKLRPFIGFTAGVSFCVFIYCIIFLEKMNLTGLILLIVGIGLLVFMPHFMALQILYKFLIRPVQSSLRKYFLSGVIIFRSFCRHLCIRIQTLPHAYPTKAKRQFL